MDPFKSNIMGYNVVKKPSNIILINNDEDDFKIMGLFIILLLFGLSVLFLSLIQGGFLSGR